jgi:phenylpropionate dioxygenase-like ring-hydroxylating dioxygenase large terminal subunit
MAVAAPAVPMRERLAAEIEHARAEVRTLPAHWYTSDEVLDVEQLHIFRRSWVPFGPLDRLRGPGDYVTGEVGGVPVLVIRDKEGELRAFVNVCRHRAHLVAEGCGNKKALQCPYHAWTYGLDGSLRGVPRAGKDFDKSGLGLAPVQVGTWGDLVLVNVDPDAAPSDTHYAKLYELAESHGFGLTGRPYRVTEEWIFECNWKVFYDNSAECYHCPTVHPSFSAEYGVSESEYALTNYDSFVHHVSPRKSRADDATRDWEMCSAWPNWSMATGEHDGLVLVWSFTPITAEQTRITTWVFADESIPDDAVAAEIGWWRDIVYGEDRLACESVQRGLHSGVVVDGPLLPSSEHVIERFQERIREALDAPPLEHVA